MTPEEEILIRTRVLHDPSLVDVALLLDELDRLRAIVACRPDTLYSLVVDYRAQQYHGVECASMAECDLLERAHRHWSEEERASLQRLFAVLSPKHDRRSSELGGVKWGMIGRKQGANGRKT